MTLAEVCKLLGAAVDPDNYDGYEYILYPSEPLDLEKSTLFRSMVDSLKKKMEEDNRILMIKIEYLFDAYFNLSLPELSLDYRYLY